MRMRWIRKVDAASFAWRNARDRGNRRRAVYWDRQMQYYSGRAVGLTHSQAQQPL